MAQIPRFERSFGEPRGTTEESTNIPASIADLSTGTPEALVSLGRIGQQATQAVSDIIARQEFQDKQNAIIAQKTAIDTELTNDLLAYSETRGINALNSDDRLQDLAENLSKKYVEDVDDQDVSFATENYLIRRINDARLQYNNHEGRERQFVHLERRNMAIESNNKDVFLGSKPLENGIRDLGNIIDTQVNAGVLRKSTGDTIKQEEYSRLAESEISGLINRDPEAALDIIREEKYNKYLSVKKIQNFRKIAKQEQDFRKKQFEKEQKDLREKAQQEAELTLGDDLLNYDPNSLREHLQQLRDILGADKYAEWIGKYHKLAKNVNKEIDEKISNRTAAELTATVITKIKNQEDLDKFKNKINDNMISLKLDDGVGRTIFGFAQNMIKKDPAKRERIKQVIDSLDVLRRNDILGETAVEGEAEFLKSVQDLMNWSEQNPDKDPVEFFEQYAEPIRRNWFTSIFKGEFRDPKAEEIQERRKEKESIVLTPESVQKMNTNELFDALESE